VRLLELEIAEPTPGRVLPLMTAEVGPEEAARRYRAIVLTTLRQLRWLEGARLRLLVTPLDGQEAVRFWLLPRLAERWARADGIFQAQGWEIDFGETAPERFSVLARAEVLCPMAGSRWVQAALTGLGTSIGSVSGPAVGGGCYFSARPGAATGVSAERVLPPLPLIRDHNDWLEALDGPLGAALGRAWEEDKG
jgi:glycosyltransferase A (GT-A) superfamily protein (DUF2064 family)